jgi:hypothetical protein
MPIKVNSGETHDEFIGRCMSEESTSFPDTPQRYAVCESIYRKQEMSKLRTSQEKFTAKLKYSQDFRGINLTNFGENSEACWEGYIQVGTKILDGREVPDCRGPVDEMEVQPQISSTYPGEPMSGSVQLAEEINVLGYTTKHFSICPGAIALFTHLQTMPLDDDTAGMIRSAAQISDSVFRIEKEVVSKGVATSSELNEVELLVDDFKDLMEEIDEELGMRHDVSFMDGHIQVVKDLV